MYLTLKKKLMNEKRQNGNNKIKLLKKKYLIKKYNINRKRKTQKN